MIVKKNGLKAIAILEATKGIVSLLVGFGLHLLIGENLKEFAETLINHAHLNPANHYPSVFIHAASKITDDNIHLIAIGALVYSAIRLVEAYGLWHAYVWTEWFALISGAIYIPFEIYGIVSHTNAINVSIFLINVVVVWYLARIVFSKREAKNHHKL